MRHDKKYIRQFIPILKEVENTKDRDILVSGISHPIIDEIQTGFGRMGKNFCGLVCKNIFPFPKINYQKKK